MNKFSYSKELKLVTTNMEEFSFPVMSNSSTNVKQSSSSSSSSSLWRISSRVYHHHQVGEGEEGDEDRRLEVHSMCEGLSPNRSEIECASCQGEELQIVEDSMDYLWEDFNEEKDVNNVREANIGKEICILQGSKSIKRGRRKPSSGKLMMGKLLKRLLSVGKKSARLNI